MAVERNVQFGEIPNTYKLWSDKTTVLERKVLIEKIGKKYTFSYGIPFDENYFLNRLNDSETHIITYRDILLNSQLEREKPKILTEKNINLINKKREILKRRKSLVSFVNNVKGDINDIVMDVTSFENIDFNRPCTKEEKIEIGKKFDYFVYKEFAYEINCEIKIKDTDGVDGNRMIYASKFAPDRIGDSLRDSFTKNITIRLSEDYLKQYYEKLDYFMNRGIRRKVMVEKTGHDFFSWKKLGFWDGNKDFKPDEQRMLRREYLNSDERRQELDMVRGEIHNRFIPSDRTELHNYINYEKTER